MRNFQFLGAAFVLRASIFAALAVVLLTGASQSQANDNPHVFVDSEIRISYDGDVAHMEAPVAASATDPNTMYAAAQPIFTRLLLGYKRL